MAVMMTPRETWTDERLDDLNKKVDDGFARLDGDIRELRADGKELRREMNERFDSMNARSDAMHQTMVRGFIAMGGITVTCFVGLAGLQAF